MFLKSLWYLICVKEFIHFFSRVLCFLIFLCVCVMFFSMFFPNDPLDFTGICCHIPPLKYDFIDLDLLSVSFV